MNPSDLITSIAKGDRKAFAQLYDLFADKVYNTAISYAQNEQDAEEITQDVFLKIHKNAAKFKGNAAPSTWIYRITVNTALTLLKKKKRFSFIALGIKKLDVPNFEHPGILLENKEHAAFLFQAIDKLPDAQKTAFILSFVEELPRKQVANIMETSLKAVESLLQRAKKNLRKILEKNYPNQRIKKKLKSNKE